MPCRAHELVHRATSRLARLWARALFAFTINPYHVYGHYRHVGTYDDPATARRGVSETPARIRNNGFDRAFSLIDRSLPIGIERWLARSKGIARKRQGTDRLIVTKTPTEGDDIVDLLLKSNGLLG